MCRNIYLPSLNTQPTRYTRWHAHTDNMHIAHTHKHFTHKPLENSKWRDSFLWAGKKLSNVSRNFERSTQTMFVPPVNIRHMERFDWSCNRTDVFLSYYCVQLFASVTGRHAPCHSAKLETLHWDSHWACTNRQNSPGTLRIYIGL